MENLPTIKFRYGGYWMELKPEDYFIKNINNGECFICILPDGSDYEMILLGNSFLKGYYSTHDL